MTKDSEPTNERTSVCIVEIQVIDHMVELIIELHTNQYLFFPIIIFACSLSAGAQTVCVVASFIPRWFCAQLFEFGNSFQCGGFFSFVYQHRWSFDDKAPSQLKNTHYIHWLISIHFDKYTSHLTPTGMWLYLCSD